MIFGLELERLERGRKEDYSPENLGETSAIVAVVPLLSTTQAPSHTKP